MRLKNKCPKCDVPLNSVLICDQCGGSLMGLAVLDAVAPRGFQKKCVEHVKALQEADRLIADAQRAGRIALQEAQKAKVRAAIALMMS